MTTLALPFPRFSLSFFRRRKEDPALGAHDAAARRDFVNMMIDENPNAFASDHDVYQMMCHLPSKF